MTFARVCGLGTLSRPHVWLATKVSRLLLAHVAHKDTNTYLTSLAKPDYRLDED